jgi:hypothetical protein
MLWYQLSQNLLNYDGPHVPVIVIMTSDSHTRAAVPGPTDTTTGLHFKYDNLGIRWDQPNYMRSI